jgi:hypothetical protein
METKRYSAYNSTRGTVVNAKLAIVDRELEPLKFLELFIGGMGLDSESGLWLKPLAVAPQVPRVFPFDLLYLDEKKRVVQAVEIFPNVEIPLFSVEVVSALVLPLRAASAAQTMPGDQLLIEAVDAVAEGPSDVPLEATEAPPQTHEVRQLLLEAVSGSPAEAQGRPLIESSATLAGSNPGPNWELPLEGFWAPLTPAPEPVPEARKITVGPEGNGDASAAASPAQISVAQTASQRDSSGEETERTSGTTAQRSSPVTQRAGFTVAQYGNWQVSTSTAPTTESKNQKSENQNPELRNSPDSSRSVAKNENRKKPTEGFLRPLETAQSTRQGPERQVGLFSREVENSERANQAGRSKSANGEPSTAARSLPSVPGAVAKRQEPQLPLWKAEPSPTARSSVPGKAVVISRSQENADPSRHAVGPEPPVRSVVPVERPKPPIQKAAKRPAAKSIVEQAAILSSHIPRMPEAFSRLMTALLHIGAGPVSQSGAKQKGQKGAAPNKRSNWLNPEALHRDRRRAVRRTVPGLVAFYFTGGAPQPYNVADISATGFYLVTRDQWMPETMIQMTLQKPVADGKQRRESLTVLTRIVRRGQDGIGAEFVMPETLDPHSRDIKPGRATDRMALARFLFSEGFPDSFEVLGCFITPPVEQPAGVQAAASLVISQRD